MSVPSNVGSNRVSWIVGFFLLIFALPGVAQVTKGKQNLEATHNWLAREVHHELVMLPYYSVFDNLAFKIEGVDTVVLMGEVVKPTLKQDAESVVRKIEGVGKVINNIEVLPVSPNDDRIRMAAYRAIYSRQGLDRYALSAVPSIHIIVKNGNLTLEGVVSKQADKDLAGITAKGVPGVFSVTNNLALESR